MNIEIILALAALFIAAASLIVVIGVSLRIRRLEWEVKQFTLTTQNFTDKDIPAFLRRQAD